MSRVAATAIAALLLAVLVDGERVDLGDRLLPGSVALVLIGAGLGVIWRWAAAARAARQVTAHGATRRPRPSPVLAAVLVALLVPLRGGLCELLLAPPGAAASVPARLAIAAATLLPPSVLAGYLLGPLLHGSLPLVLAGALAGGALLWAGATGWVSAWLSGPAGALLLLLIGARAEARVPEDDERRVAPGVLLIGGAAALFVAVLARVVPSYTTPSTSPALDALAALLAPAALVAWPAARVLGRGRLAQAILGGGGALLLAVALFHAVDALSLYLQPTVVVTTTRSLHVQAARLSPWMDDWWLWLLSFAALGAASLGLALAPLPARAAGALACGAGLALLATQLVPLDASHGPATWLLVASALAAAAAPPALLGRRGWWLSPAALLVLSLSPVERRPGFDEVRRPGELSVEGLERTPLLDVTLYSTPASSSVSVEGRLAQRTAFAGHEPAVMLAPDGSLATPAEAEGTHLGLRFGGLAWSPGHDPLGPAGTVGRLTRLFGAKGRALVAGPAAELLAADLFDAGLLESAVVASDAPLGGLTLVILASRGSKAWQAASVREPLAASRAEGESFDTVLLAPARASWPGAETLASEELLERVAARLTASGRCLLWLDTTDLDAGALAARVAAFGQVFGERSLAFVEPRELDPPLVLLVGWRGEVSRPAPDELAARLAAAGDAGRLVPLRTVDDLGALLLRDGAGMVEAGEEWSELRASNPAPGSRWGTCGWAAVAGVAEPEAKLPGAAAPVRHSNAVYDGLAEHARYEYDLADLNETVLEIRPDVDWQAFEREAEDYARAARENPGDPLLQHALVSLLEPLAVAGDYGRFARVYESTGARSMRNVRLALLEAWVQQRSLEPEAAEAALQRAREWSR